MSLLAALPLPPPHPSEPHAPRPPAADGMKDDGTNATQRRLTSVSFINWTNLRQLVPGEMARNSFSAMIYGGDLRLDDQVPWCNLSQSLANISSGPRRGYVSFKLIHHRLVSFPGNDEGLECIISLVDTHLTSRERKKKVRKQQLLPLFKCG